jgi:hypothetical protein
MTHPIVKAVSNLVFEGNIDSAERALATVADQEGDFALARVIDEMAPRDLVAILREHDASRGSIISELISPAQFLAAVSLESGYRERGHESLKGMINAVVFADAARTDDFIETLGSTPEGVAKTSRVSQQRTVTWTSASPMTAYAARWCGKAKSKTTTGASWDGGCAQITTRSFAKFWKSCAASIGKRWPSRHRLQRWRPLPPPQRP